MGKINARGEATAAGMTGIVQNAEGKLSELDPSRRLDGTPVDGYESDERDFEDFEKRETPAGPDSEPQVEEHAQEEMDAANERAAKAPLSDRIASGSTDSEEKPVKRAARGQARAK